MTVPLTGTGGYFSRQGAFIGEFNRVTAFYGTGLDAGFLSIWAQFASSDQAAVQDLPGAVATYRTTAQQYQNTLIQDGMLASVLQVDDDTNLVPYSFPQSLVVLISQMKTNSQSV